MSLPLSDGPKLKPRVVLGDLEERVVYLSDTKKDVTSATINIAAVFPCNEHHSMPDGSKEVPDTARNRCLNIDEEKNLLAMQTEAVNNQSHPGVSASGERLPNSVDDFEHRVFMFNQDQLATAHAALRGDYALLTSRLNQLCSEHSALSDAYKELTSDHSEVCCRLALLTSDYDALASQHRNLSYQHKELTATHSEFTAAQSELTATHCTMVTVHDKLAVEHARTQEETDLKLVHLISSKAEIECQLETVQTILISKQKELAEVRLAMEEKQAVVHDLEIQIRKMQQNFIELEQRSLREYNAVQHDLDETRLAKSKADAELVVLRETEVQLQQLTANVKFDRIMVENLEQEVKKEVAKTNSALQQLQDSRARLEELEKSSSCKDIALDATTERLTLTKAALKSTESKLALIEKKLKTTEDATTAIKMFSGVIDGLEIKICQLESAASTMLVTAREPLGSPQGKIAEAKKEIMAQAEDLQVELQSAKAALESLKSSTVPDPPAVKTEVKLDGHLTDFSDYKQQQFVEELARELRVSVDSISISGLREGSIIIEASIVTRDPGGLADNLKSLEGKPLGGFQCLTVACENVEDKVEICGLQVELAKSKEAICSLEAKVSVARTLEAQLRAELQSEQAQNILSRVEKQELIQQIENGKLALGAMEAKLELLVVEWKDESIAWQVQLDKYQKQCVVQPTEHACEPFLQQSHAEFFSKSAETAGLSQATLESLRAQCERLENAVHSLSAEKLHLQGQLKNLSAELEFAKQPSCLNSQAQQDVLASRVKELESSLSDLRALESTSKAHSLQHDTNNGSNVSQTCDNFNSTSSTARTIGCFRKSFQHARCRLAALVPDPDSSSVIDVVLQELEEAFEIQARERRTAFIEELRQGMASRELLRARSCRDWLVLEVKLRQALQQSARVTTELKQEIELKTCAFSKAALRLEQEVERQIQLVQALQADKDSISNQLLQANADFNASAKQVQGLDARLWDQSKTLERVTLEASKLREALLAQERVVEELQVHLDKVNTENIKHGEKQCILQLELGQFRANESPDMQQLLDELDGLRDQLRTSEAFYQRHRMQTARKLQVQQGEAIKARRKVSLLTTRCEKLNTGYQHLREQIELEAERKRAEALEWQAELKSIYELVAEIQRDKESKESTHVLNTEQLKGVISDWERKQEEWNCLLAERDNLHNETISKMLGEVQKEQEACASLRAEVLNLTFQLEESAEKKRSLPKMTESRKKNLVESKKNTPTHPKSDSPPRSVSASRGDSWLCGDYLIPGQIKPSSISSQRPANIKKPALLTAAVRQPFPTRKKDIKTTSSNEAVVVFFLYI
jgi:hypothetical protein